MAEPLTLRKTEGAVPIKLADIIDDSSVQPRVKGIDAKHVKALTQAGPDAWPPLVVVERDAGYVLADGRHRLTAARDLGCEEIACEVRDESSVGDLRTLAFALNAAHGKPFTLADRKAEAARLIGTCPDLADREIARHCGLSPTTVGTLRPNRPDSGQEGSIVQNGQSGRRVGKNGRSYPTERKRPPQCRPSVEAAAADADVVPAIDAAPESPASSESNRTGQAAAEAPDTSMDDANLVAAVEPTAPAPPHAARELIDRTIARFAPDDPDDTGDDLFEAVTTRPRDDWPGIAEIFERAGEIWSCLAERLRDLSNAS
jgi:hypothetical protein